MPFWQRRCWFCSFLRDKTTAKGGPDGGDGGHGGSILLEGNEQMWTLLHLRYKNTFLQNMEVMELEIIVLEKMEKAAILKFP